jgi:drug/metabolite transporter (DMT)-like permease
MSTFNTRARLFILGAMLTIGVIDVFVASISQVMGLWQLLLLRAVCMIPLALLCARLFHLGRLEVGQWRWVVLRSALFGTGLSIYFGALGVMPLAQALAGMYASPIFVALITLFFLRSAIGPVRVGAAVLGFCGILMVQKLNITQVHPSVFAALSAGFLYACAAIITRQRCAGESALTLVVAMVAVQGIWGVLGLMTVSVIDPALLAGLPEYLSRGWVWDVSAVQNELILQMFGSVLITVLVTKAYQLGETAEIAVLENTVFVFGPFFAFLWLGQVIDVVQMIGIGVIVMASATISLRTQRAER